jgi:hypothetical protein
MGENLVRDERRVALKGNDTECVSASVTLCFCHCPVP